jgi:hypothetical protein
VDHSEYLSALAAVLREIEGAEEAASRAGDEDEAEEISLAVNALMRAGLARLQPPLELQDLHRGLTIFLEGPPPDVRLTQAEEIAWSRRFDRILATLHERCVQAGVKLPAAFHPSQPSAGSHLYVFEKDGEDGPEAR